MSALTKCPCGQRPTEIIIEDAILSTTKRSELRTVAKEIAPGNRLARRLAVAIRRNKFTQG